MPVVLKNKTKVSPGIIIFTHNEILRGVPRKSSRVDNLLKSAYLKNEWIFGVHIQGDCSNVYNWPYKEWQNFFLWPEKKDHFLSSISENKICEITCVNFLSEKINHLKNKKKDIDIISVSRFSSIKKIDLTLRIFKGLLDKNPNYKFVLLAIRENKEKNFLNILRNIFKFKNKEEKYIENLNNLIDKINKSPKYKNIKIIDPMITKDNLFPIPEEKIYHYTAKSKYQMLNSSREGVPRVLIESLYLKTKVIISNQLKFGLKKFMNDANSLQYDESNGIESIINDLHENLTKPIDYSKEFLENDKFKENKSKVLLVNFLRNLKLNENNYFEGIDHSSWKLDNLKFRLCSHFKSRSHQILKNEKLFINWFDSLNKDEDYNDEKYSYLFSSDKKDIFLEIEFFFQRLKNYILRKFKIY